MTINNTILKILDPNIGVVLSSTDDKKVYRFFKKILGKDKVYGLDDTEFLHRPIHLVICSNKIETIEKSLKMAYYLHVPIVILDMAPKPEFMSHKKISPPNMTYMQIATNSNIANSWDIDSYHDIVDINISDTNCINKWKELLDTISKTTFNVNIEQETDKENEHEQPTQYSFNYQ